MLIKVSCCHYEPPTLTYTFRKIQWGLEGKRPDLGAQKLSSCGRQGGLKWSCGGGNGEKYGCSVGGAEEASETCDHLPRLLGLVRKQSPENTMEEKARLERV